MNFHFNTIVTVAYLISVGLFITVASILYWPTPEFAFVSDQSPLAWLSSAQLWAIGLFSLRLANERALPPAMAFWLFAAMVVLAFDEQFMLHEQWKYGCEKWWSACEIYGVRELPMILVAVIGTGTVLHLHRVLTVRSSRWLFWLALVTGLFALSIDLLSWPTAFLRFEEGFEAVAEAFFAAALLELPAGRMAHEHSV